MTARFLRHITLNTGHSRDSVADEVRPDVIDAMVQFVDGLGDEPVGIPPPLDGYAVTGFRRGLCMTATMLWERTPIITIGVAAHSLCGRALWDNLIEGVMPIPGAAEFSPRPPPEPWLAVRLEPSFFRRVPEQHIGMFGDFERCLGWGFLAWLERRPQLH
ncbi:MAG: hypothetical protein J2P47_03785 [Acetobacteraceae bacterium]|nr:hypothetical protein [Acetobacteraceae bacterium]